MMTNVRNQFDIMAGFFHDIKHEFRQIYHDIQCKNIEKEEVKTEDLFQRLGIIESQFKSHLEMLQQNMPEKPILLAKSISLQNTINKLLLNFQDPGRSLKVYLNTDVNLKMHEFDLYRLLSNVYDNAMTHFNYKDILLVFNVSMTKNNTTIIITQKGETILESYSHKKSGYGLGIQIIENIMKKYNGSAIFFHVEDFKIVLDFPSTE
jgi:hypothetical protein